MPELPEVETMCRRVAAVVGCRIRGLWQPRGRLQPIAIRPPLAVFRRRVRGRRILAVRRLGKRVVLPLDNGEAIVLEPRMSGLVLLGDPPDLPHLRLVFHLSDGKARQLLFWDQRGLGVAQLLSPSQLVEMLGPDNLGPDALEISPRQLRERLGESRRAIKVALLDQRAVAGVGNLYASEILHRAGVHPATPCNLLSGQQWRRIHRAMNAVLRAAIRHQGSTLGDGTYRIARNKPGRFQLFHQVYGRAGQPCARCGRGQVVRIVQVQRSTFFCPRCQPTPPPPP